MMAVAVVEIANGLMGRMEFIGVLDRAAATLSFVARAQASTKRPLISSPAIGTQPGSSMFVDEFLKESGNVVCRGT
jgi:hypothetical protein